MDYPSKLIENAMEQFATLPGIGRKTALRLALHLLKQNKEEVNQFGQTLMEMRQNIRFCKECFNVSDHEVCHICSSHKRNRVILCVVEDMRDVMAIENTQQYRGLYHVLGGIISPMDGIGPADLNVDPLLKRVQSTEVNEVILALSSTMEGDTTSFYLFKKLNEFPISISTIARGVPVGDELEYADEITLGRSIANRMPYEGALSVK